MTRNTGTPFTTEGRRDGRPEGRQALRQIPELLDELREYAAHYATVRKDLAGAQARGMLTRVALGAVGGIAGLAVILVSTWLLLTGLAIGLGWLFGGRMWLSYLVLGFVVLVAALAAAFGVIRAWANRTAESTIQKYAQMKDEHCGRLQHAEGASAAKHDAGR